MRSHRPCLLALLVVALAPRHARADAPLSARRALVEIGGRATAFEYAEYGADGSTLDDEIGTVPGIEGAVELRLGPVALRGLASFGGATLRYAGHVQSGNVQLNGRPITSTSGARLVAAGAEAAVLLPYARGVALIAGATSRRWDRTIHATTATTRTGVTVPVGGLAETYRWFAVAAGVRIPLVDAQRVTWDAEGRVTGTLRPAVTVGWPTGDVSLPLAPRVGWAVGTALRVALGRVLVGRLGFALERWEFGASDVDGRTRLREPRSATRTASCDLAIGARY